MKISLEPTSRAKPISWVTTTMVMPAIGQILHDVQHFGHQFGVESGGHLVEQHHVGLHGQGPGDGDPLLLATGELVREGMRLLCQADLDKQVVGDLLDFGFRLLLYLEREPS